MSQRGPTPAERAFYRFVHTVYGNDPVRRDALVAAMSALNVTPRDREWLQAAIGLDLLDALRASGAEASDDVRTAIDEALETVEHVTAVAQQTASSADKTTKALATASGSIATASQTLNTAIASAAKDVGQTVAASILEEQSALIERLLARQKTDGWRIAALVALVAFLVGLFLGTVLPTLSRAQPPARPAAGHHR